MRTNRKEAERFAKMFDTSFFDYTDFDDIAYYLTRHYPRGIASNVLTFAMSVIHHSDNAGENDDQYTLF